MHEPHNPARVIRAARVVSPDARPAASAPVTEFQVYSPEGVSEDAHVVLPQSERPTDDAPVTEFQVYSPEGVSEDAHVVLEKPQKPALARRGSIKEAVVNAATSSIKKVVDMERKVVGRVNDKILEVEKSIPYKEK